MAEPYRSLQDAQAEIERLSVPAPCGNERLEFALAASKTKIWGDTRSSVAVSWNTLTPHRRSASSGPLQGSSSHVPSREPELCPPRTRQRRGRLYRKDDQ
jgi:hypothetical protein